MFKLSEKYQTDRKILKRDYIRYSASEISTKNTPNSQIHISIPRQDSVISLLKNYLKLNFEVLLAATSNRYADGNDIRLFNRGVIALFSIYKTTTSSGKHLEEINHAHIVSLMYKFLTSSKNNDDFSICFDRSRDRRKRELTNNKNIKGKYHVRVFLRDIFGFAEHQKAAIYGLGCKLTLTRNTDNAVLNKGNAMNNAKNKISALEWCVPHYTPSLEGQKKLMNQIKKKRPQTYIVQKNLFS